MPNLAIDPEPEQITIERWVNGQLPGGWEEQSLVNL